MLHTDILCWDTLSDVLQLHISGFSFSTLLLISYSEEIQVRSNETKTANWIDKQFHDWQERIWNKLGIRTIYKQGDWIKIKAYKYIPSIFNTMAHVIQKSSVLIQIKKNYVQHHKSVCFHLPCMHQSLFRSSMKHTCMYILKICFNDTFIITSCIN